MNAPQSNHLQNPPTMSDLGQCRMGVDSLKILVVDSEPAIRKLLRMGLRTQGYEVCDASNGKVALERIEEKPALVLMDLALPDIQGHELLRMMRGRNENVPIILLSSKGDEAGKVQGSISALTTTLRNRSA
jgi:two-component system KDP operon response regulator KdpE